MLRRFTTNAPAAAPQVDDLMAGALPDRVQIAHERLAHQDDPALLEALSERELAAARELAELVRDYERHEQRARIQAAADAAERVRRTAAELAEREAADLLRAAQAIGEQRHSSSPHAKVARLHQRKPRVLGLLAGVVAFSMLFSAVTVQQNIAPTGGVTNPMFWLSYGLEALISAVLVALMLSTADTAEWGVIERLWQVYTVEGVLLTASIALNTFPYFKAGDLTGIGIHAIAPIMIGVALVTHRLVAERYGRAIEQATAAVPDKEDLQERLVALTKVGGAGNQILPSILEVAPAARGERHADPEEPVEAHPDVDGGSEQSAAPSAPEANPTPEARSESGADTSPEPKQPTAQAEAPAAEPSPPVPAAPFTELWLATTPLPAEQSANNPGNTPAGSTDPGEPEPGNAQTDGTDPGEAELDARLADAVRKTLQRLRTSEQSDPVAVAPSARSAPVVPDGQRPENSEGLEHSVVQGEPTEAHTAHLEQQGPAQVARDPVNGVEKEPPSGPSQEGQIPSEPTAHRAAVSLRRTPQREPDEPVLTAR
ncbi:hypothetical protein [Nocardia cyriacigeorgica]|nr:hypothetical protein [Nocardia cyriacigeorgica]AVH22348.1 hypothetical protein C5B73_13760 [Nocardia cyriacigeorgica]MBF6321957.1 hypothetical protein [Nocardia cyriacigeorgica]MBF6497683.1 hypothetical protein [Nocardia cyriacigeorgica]PPJ10900.1 hypothetical protein C5E43_12615 [Nocardia cyriacigeorgica]